MAAFALASFQTGEVGETLPDTLQFALGGANTVRGWSLAAHRAQSVHRHGGYTFVARQVAPFSIFGFNAYGGLQLVAFADTGLAWNHSADRQSAITGYGAGLRVLVPFVDLVRIDVAWGEPGQGATAYFGISLKAARQRQRVR